MESEKMHETRKNVRERAEKVKQLLKEYRKTYNRICIVSHFYTIQCLCAKEFTEDDEPKISIESHNGGSYETSVKAVCGPWSINTIKFSGF